MKSENSPYQSISSKNFEHLKSINTATIATALFKRGLKNQFIQDVQPLHETTENMVGRAYTLRYIPAREDLNPISVFKSPKHPQRLAVEECPSGSILVIDSRQNANAASAGSILVSRLKMRHVNGIVTDGGFRDSKEISALHFPAYHQRPSAPTNLTLHQAIDINVPIGCGNAPVFPGDIVVGDHDGVIVIPQEFENEIINECLEMTLFEDFVMEKVNEGMSIIGLYPATDSKYIEEFTDWKKRQ